MKLLKVTLVVGVAALLFAQGDNALQKAIRKETLEGDLKGAIEQYKKLAQGKDRPVAAQALVHLGQCYEKLGDTESRRAYERVVREFGEQKEPVAVAGARLAALGKPASGANARLIDKDVDVVGVSPNGRFLLQYTMTGDMDLRDLQTGQIRHLAKGPWYGAGFSPDGRQVAFIRYSNDGRELRIIGADGSGERLLWQSDKNRGAGLPQWFPDGKRIMVDVWLGKDRSGLVAIAATDGAATTLWEGRQLHWPRLSPDGKSVVYARRLHDEPAADELWMLRLADQSESLLFEGHSVVFDPRWTPDGTGVMFLSDRRMPGRMLDLWLLRSSGGKPPGFPQLVRADIGEMVEGRPTVYGLLGPVPRDGAYYFHRFSQIGGMRQLLTTKFDPETGKAVGAPSFVSRNGGESWGPSYSQDGRWLAYLSKSSGSALANLMIQSVETREERVVTMTPSPVQLDWAKMFPDGRSVLVDAVHPKDGKGIYRVDVSTGAWTSLKKPGERQIAVFSDGISPDGRTLYLSRWLPDEFRQMHLIARDVETGQERELGTWRNGVEGALSPDGKQLAIGRRDGQDVVVIDIQPATGGPKRELYRGPGFPGAETWTPDGQYLVFTSSDKNDSTRGYKRVAVEGGEPQPIGISASQDEQVRFPREFGKAFFNPNGRQFIYTAKGDTDKGETWALENFLQKAAK